jgi:hypothetical protein
VASGNQTAIAPVSQPGSFDRPATVTADLAVGRGGWIVSPIFDLLFITNIYWGVALLPVYVSSDGEPYIQFWMAYFLATPHRWLTLVVAATDRDRRYGQTWLFAALAIGCAGLVGGTMWATGDFRHLFLFYTLLLGFHFAGQHTFVLRIYSGRTMQRAHWTEAWLPSAFLLYTNVRLVSFVQPLVEVHVANLINYMDFAAFSIPCVLVARELVQFSPQRLPKLLYMISCFGLWSAVLWSAHSHRTDTCSVLLAAVTVYHSVEYLALVSYYASRRRKLGSKGLFQAMAANWTVVLAWYVLGCGLLYALGNATIVIICFAVNTWASSIGTRACSCH